MQQCNPVEATHQQAEPIMQQIITYYRVSTKEQGKSGLGLDGQKLALKQYVGSIGATMIAEYQEVESGTKCDRPELAKAIAHAKRSRAVLVVAKLDRLARNVAFLSNIMESGVDFIACDNPHANRFTVHILAAVAEDEQKKISDRTKTALQVAKQRGKKLGSSRENHWHGREERRQAGAIAGGQSAATAHTEAANAAYSDLYPMIQKRQQDGKTLREIAIELNSMGHTTRRGKPWNASQVMRVANRGTACN
jgi:DNA invertase Pin-like site-specific DNA recombinase